MESKRDPDRVCSSRPRCNINLTGPDTHKKAIPIAISNDGPTGKGKREKKMFSSRDSYKNHVIEFDIMNGLGGFQKRQEGK